jgi:hypothetical protein
MTNSSVRSGGVCAAVGGVLALLGSLTQPTFDGDFDVVLEGIATSQWRPVALLLQLAGIVLLAIGGLSIAAVLAERPGGVAAAAARPLLIIGGAVALSSLAIGMHALRQLAEVHTAAGATDAALSSGYAVGTLVDALDNLWLLVLLGLVPVLLAVAMFRTRLFPVWLAAMAAAGGVVGTVVGTIGLFAIDDLDLGAPALIGELLVGAAVIAAGALLAMRKVQP